MSEYRAIYKCRLCGEEFEENKVNRNIAHAITVIFGVGTPDAFEVPFTNETVYKIIAHDCKDDSYGLADFVGFRKVED